jgi:hypothetical protein
LVEIEAISLIPDAKELIDEFEQFRQWRQSRRSIDGNK